MSRPLIRTLALLLAVAAPHAASQQSRLTPAELAASEARVSSAASAPFVGFESGPVQPLLVTNDGTRLLALNVSDGRLEIFEIREGEGAAADPSPSPNPRSKGAASGGVLAGGTPGTGGPTAPSPTLEGGLELAPIGSVFTGLEPVAIAAHPTNDDIVFVSNAISDSVAVVALSEQRVVASVPVGDEPSGLVATPFAVFVTTARTPETPLQPGRSDPGAFKENPVVVMRANPPYTILTSVRIPAVKPRDVVDADGRLYVIPQNSGNRTTLMSFDDAVANGVEQNQIDQFNPTIDINPALLNPNLFFPDFAPGWVVPVVSKIVLDTEMPGPKLPDADLIGLNPTSLQFTGVVNAIGTTLFDVEYNAPDGTVWISATDANNRVRFEPVLKGDAVDNRVVVVDPDTGVLDVLSLKPPFLPRRHGQPVALELAQGSFGGRAFVASHGTSTVIALDTASRTYVDEFLTGELPVGLEYDAEREVLFVLSRGDASIRAYDAADLSLAAGPVPVGYDPEPPIYSAGRDHLYDSRGTTGHGNGTMSCAACHVFGHHDASAWDLGDPGGGISYYYPDILGNIPGQSLIQAMVAPQQVANHPMKGPMVTQSLRGLLDPDEVDGLPLHWRGDRRFFQMFRNAFVGLHGGSGIAAAEVQEFASFLRMLEFPPNPYQPRDREYTGIAALGRDLYGMNPDVPGKKMQADQDFLCITCHEGNFTDGDDFTGSNPGINSGVSQMINMPTLRGVYEKEYKNLTGFGILHDGEIPGVRAFFEATMMGSGQVLAPNFTTADRDAVSEFVKQWDAGISPLVGGQWFATPATAAGTVAFLDLAEAEASEPVAQVDLTLKIALTNVDPPARVGGVYREEGGEWLYHLDDGAALTRAELFQFFFDNDAEALFTCVLPGTGVRFGIDRDEDGLLDGAEALAGTSPIDPDTDRDGYTDGFEVSIAADPKVADATLADVVRPTVLTLSALEVFADTATLTLLADEPVTFTADIDEVVSGADVVVVTSDELRSRHDLVVDRLPAGVELRASLVVSDRNGNETSADVVFTTQPPLLHVDDMTLEATGAGPYDVVATVRVVDHAGALVAGVPVTGFWDGDIGGVDWQQEAVTDANGVATFVLPTFTPTVFTPISFMVAYVGTDDPQSPWFVGGGTPDWVPGFFYEQSMNAANFRTIELP